METMSKRRRRVYSPEPNKIMRANVARRYVKYLLPALKQIGRSTLPPPTVPHHELSDNKNGDHRELEKMVRREVDMAMVLSTDEEGFAWSHALKARLQRSEECGDDNNDVNYAVSAVGDNQKKLEVDGGGGGGEAKGCRRTDQNLSKENKEEEEDEEEVSRGLMNLKSVLPGGDEMDIEEMLIEVGSYIVCLELQMDILKSLVEAS